MILSHEKFKAKITYRDGDDMMHGVVLNSEATLHFCGSSIEELKSAFAETIADYKAFRMQRRIKELEAENDRLKAEINKLCTITSIPTYDGRTGELLFPKRNEVKHD